VKKMPLMFWKRHLLQAADDADENENNTDTGNGDT
jgi:hypothetical protein